MTYPLLTIDQLHYTVTRITTHQYNDNKGIDRRILKTATGFFYHNLQSDLLFLVTNRHVVCDRNYLPNVITITLHSDENDMTQNKEYLIHLYNKITPIWRSSDHPEVDVVAIPIDRKDFASLDIKYISFASNNLLPKDLQLEVGEDVFIMGYPLGIYDEVHNLPVIRGGTISSAYPILWNRRPYFLVDANLEEGTSGSPVLTKFKGI
jgi:S1-C subfamily serine protease